MYGGTSNLQQTIAASSAHSPDSSQYSGPHHPITCYNGKLYYEEDGTFHCEHAEASSEDVRTQVAVNHSISILIIELAMEEQLGTREG